MHPSEFKIFHIPPHWLLGDRLGHRDRGVLLKHKYKTQMLEHDGRRADQPMHQHLKHCIEFHDVTNLFALTRLFGNFDGINHKEHIINAVLNMCKILDINDN